ncbi:NADAR family protein [Actinomadura decatromicini]|uniref:NADAR family protein n=1 Tax=Actinomadura decatromicini TaxID=2604572 RepID=A0A5D3G0A3_9ACTN|nr:NADAR family protein [Actinomadura decatromicini]TYK52885.1 NADAR family protein [Actinomadura decatromicini]
MVDSERRDALSARSVAELIPAAEAGGVKYLFFWGHQKPGPGYLSQWWLAAFTVDGTVYATAEHYMMAEKARLFGDAETAEAIVAASHPSEAKDLGRRVRGFDDDAWRDARVAIVVKGNEAKFGQHEELREYLVGTRNRVLVEASPLDRVWGIGLAADDPRAERPAEWRGLNLLGFALMTVRDSLGSDLPRE